MVWFLSFFCALYRSIRFSISTLLELASHIIILCDSSIDRSIRFSLSALLELASQMTTLSRIISFLFFFCCLYRFIHFSERKESATGKIMEEMRRLAKIYYDVGDEEMRKDANKFFDSMDTKRDGKISLHEYLGFMAANHDGPLRQPKWFRKLDKEKKGNLSREDVRTLYYMINSGRPFCIGCGKFVGTVYFTCLKCFNVSCTLISVCLECYEANSFHHEHDQFLDNFALLEFKRTGSQFPALKAPAENPQDAHAEYPENTKELRRIAKAYLRSTLEDSAEQWKIQKFLDSVYHHGFPDFMKNKAYRKILGKKLELSCRDTDNFLKLLAKDTKNRLDKFDVETFYYIVRSGRPFCGGNCGRFITGTFFTCVECFRADQTKCFYLCPKCFRKGKFEENHRLILDNYALLHAMGVASQAKTVPKKISPSNDPIVSSSKQINSANNSLVLFVRQVNTTLSTAAGVASFLSAIGCVIM